MQFELDPDACLETNRVEPLDYTAQHGSRRGPHQRTLGVDDVAQHQPGSESPGQHAKAFEIGYRVEVRVARLPTGEQGAVLRLAGHAVTEDRVAERKPVAIGVFQELFRGDSFAPRMPPVIGPQNLDRPQPAIAHHRLNSIPHASPGRR